MRYFFKSLFKPVRCGLTAATDCSLLDPAGIRRDARSNPAGRSQQTYPEEQIQKDQDRFGGGDAALPHFQSDPRPVSRKDEVSPGHVRHFQQPYSTEAESGRTGGAAPPTPQE